MNFNGISTGLDFALSGNMENAVFIIVRILYPASDELNSLFSTNTVKSQITLAAFSASSRSSPLTIWRIDPQSDKRLELMILVNAA